MRGRNNIEHAGKTDDGKAALMKKILKNILAAIVYFLYEKNILHNSIRVCSVDETLDVLLNTNKSMVRFGDGEIVMIRGVDLVLQQASEEIGRGLSEILRYSDDDLLVTIPDIFDTLSDHHRASRQFWKDHLLFSRKIYETYCDPNRVYGSTFVSRCYYFAQDKSRCEGWFEKIRRIWANKDVVVVEGSRTHNGVDNDLLSLAGSVERIICPPSNAYASLDRILFACRQYGKDRLFLLSVGVAAKFIAASLFRDGYRVLDIGNLDMEYEWFLRKTPGKEAITKHDIVGEEANRAAGYEEYLRQIRVWL